jgi:hypothetical protein
VTDEVDDNLLMQALYRNRLDEIGSMNMRGCDIIIQQFLSIKIDISMIISEHQQTTSTIQ